MQPLTYDSLVPQAERFWSYVERREVGDCWPWRGGVSGSGYGQFHPWANSTIGAHRVAWALANQRDPIRGRVAAVDHMCNVRICCNPAHLVEASYSENVHAGKAGRAVERTASGKYKVRFREDRQGRIVQTSRTFGNQADAERFAADLKRAAGFAPRIAR